jgi:hypothetical protein
VQVWSNGATTGSATATYLDEVIDAMDLIVVLWRQIRDWYRRSIHDLKTISNSTEQPIFRVKHVVQLICLINRQVWYNNLNSCEERMHADHLAGRLHFL